MKRYGNEVRGRINAFADFAGVVGLEAALLLAAWHPDHPVAIPRHVDERHILFRLLGRDAFEVLVDKWGGDSLYFPTGQLRSVHLAGRIFRLMKRGVIPADISEVLGITTRHVQRIAAALKGEGRLFHLDDEVEGDEDAKRADKQKPTALPSMGLASQLPAARSARAAKDRDYVG